MKNEILFKRKDGKSYSDSGLENLTKANITDDNFKKFEEMLAKHPEKASKINW
jgi:hypothetical protein